jgi:hypothetical protein
VKMTESRRVVGVWGVDRLDQARVGSIKAWLGPGAWGQHGHISQHGARVAPSHAGIGRVGPLNRLVKS